MKGLFNVYSVVSKKYDSLISRYVKALEYCPQFQEIKSRLISELFENELSESERVAIIAFVSEKVFN